MVDLRDIRPAEWVEIVRVVTERPELFRLEPAPLITENSAPRADT